MSGQVYRLEGAQRDAIDPRESVWLSASAGTGKTQVLSARVLRLLLRSDTRPEQILCLTFTKAGAAEMAVRVNDVLARWVRLPDTKLASELGFIGAPIDPDTIARARSLFASVLDCPGGGLRIDTIHAFAQYLLASFPEEARLMPGTSAMDDRERDLLSRKVLGDLLIEAQRENDKATLHTIAEISRSKGPDAVIAWLMRCVAHHDLWIGPGAWSPPMRPRVSRLLGLSPDATREDAARLCDDAQFDLAAVREALQIAQDWDTATGRKIAEFLISWLAFDPATRLENLHGFYGTALTKAGTPIANLVKRAPEYGSAMERVITSLKQVEEQLALIELADSLTPMLELGRKFALQWDVAKAREGLIDFDDQIRRAASLLGDADMAPWIRYKMDRQFDHILIDEAQDTNRSQWDIIFGLIDDFYDGLGARDGKVRTIFTVGDYKQAIFGFQGTSPRNFQSAKERVAEKMAGAAENAAKLHDGPEPRYLNDLDLAQSYRTSEPVLDFVDRALEIIGPQSFGLEEGVSPHIGQPRAGLVTLWNTVTSEFDDDGEDSETEEEGWLSRHDRQMADRIARQIAEWMSGDAFTLEKDGKRRATPGDVMVLVRKRRELASLIVARLYARGVPVAGVDRLRLGNPLAVKDLMAALRFAVQPRDDLTLASLLVSPLGGWSQDDLLEHGYRPKNVGLWDHIRASEAPLVVATVASLGEILARADFSTPQALLHHILVGPMKGRQKLVARLGREANDPIDELLNAAQSYASSHIVSLQGFIQWFDAGDGELKRESGEGGDQVRVMTVHGSKGLQAPIVILADAAGRPSPPGALTLAEDLPGPDHPKHVPLPTPTKDQRVGPVLAAYEAAEAAEMEEHWRLLYVAMTRAEEALFIGGSLSPREKGEAHEDSWYARLKPLFGEDALDDPIWGARWEHGQAADPIASASKRKEASPDLQLPDWARQPVGAEPRPPRPLAPSSLGEAEPAFPPMKPGARLEAARRGTLIHALLERLPDVAESERKQAADLWLARHADELDASERKDILDQAMRVMTSEDLAALFGPESLAEVPFSALVDNRVIVGSVDRLLVDAKRVQIVDYKTTRRPPEAIGDIPAATIQQMAAYAAALEQIYPERAVQVSLVYTQTPQIFTLPSAMLRDEQARLSV